MPVLIQLAFATFACVLIGSALGVITAKNPVHAVLMLALSFVTSAFLWILLEAEFLALSLILVYVGAVMVLFLFVVMMLDTRADESPNLRRYWLPALVVGGILVIELALLFTRYFSQVPLPPLRSIDFSNLREVGLHLFQNYVLAIELAAMVLLLAIVVAIQLTLRPGRARKQQRPEEQAEVSKADRLSIVKVASGHNGEH